MEISIIIPVYNKIRYLSELLEMVAGQSFSDFECLLIDDGSTDGSEDVCDDYSKKDPRFQTFHIANGGVSHARNVGIEKANGKYITFIDSDDEIHTDYLKNLYHCLITHGVDMVIGSHARIWDSDKPREIVRYPIEGIYRLTDILPCFADLQRNFGIFGWCCAKLFPRSLISGIEFDQSIKLAEDFDFYLKLYPGVKTVCFDSAPYYYYRQAAENSSMLLPDADIDYLTQLKINLRYRAFLKQMDAYKDNNKMIVDQLLCNYVYFSLFHCRLSLLSDRFDKLYAVCRDEKIQLRGKGFLKRWILFTVRIKAKYAARWTLQCYRFLRRVKNGLSNHTDL